VLIEARSLTKEYTRKSFFSELVTVRAIDNADFHVEEASVIALVGASGSGKSTLARCLAGLERPTRGTILYRGEDIFSMSQPQMRDYRRKVPIVFQEAASTINPRFTAASAVAEPLKIAGMRSRQERNERAIHWMAQVGLKRPAADRPALELSGGERQRLAIARALIANPEVIIFDESFSALDLPVATRILTLLDRLRDPGNLTYLFIGHNLALLARICQDVAVMYEGRIVDRESMQNFLTRPTHAYSRELVRAIPRLPPGWLA
jgi:ABC-type glutathione transport system ATPase component